MSNEQKKPIGPQQGPMGQGPRGMMSGGEKPKSMKLALKKLITYLKPFIPQLLFIMIFAMT
jgi:ATP-binding cassette, subfamily B, multidrug efflux pump